MLEDEQIGCALARQPHHILIVIFDPSMDGLSVHELNRNGFLFFSQRFKESGLLEGIFRRRRTAALGGIGIPLRSAERHAGIVNQSAADEGEGTLHPGENGRKNSTIPETVARPAGGVS
jgi:hypothetical protein